MMIEFSKAKVLCVGDIMLDRFVLGDVKRISPEAPVPVFQWITEKRMLGGVGNVAANISSLGATATIVARIGSDAEGEIVNSLLSNCGVESLLFTSTSVPTTQKTRFVAQGNHIMRMDRESIIPISSAEESALIPLISSKLPDTDIVVISDYGKGFVTNSFSAKLINLCRTAKKPVYIDPKGADYSKYKGASLIKPNLKELEIACGVKIDPAASNFISHTASCARDLITTNDITSAVVTLSEHGMLYVSAINEEIIHLPTAVHEVSDVSGAGDTTMAALTVARCGGATFREAMSIANVAAGVVVGKVGTAVVSQQELNIALTRDRQDQYMSGNKILSLDELVRLTAQWKSSKLRVGVTNGCFDCIHCGHISSLRQTKAHCDKLIVAINSDASVRRLKGASRPIQDEQTRSQVLANLELVDAVVVFDDDTALHVIENIRPDIVAKDGYPLDKWPEGQFVMSYGGKALVLQHLEGYSTSSIIDRIRSK